MVYSVLLGEKKKKSQIQVSKSDSDEFIKKSRLFWLLDSIWSIRYKIQLKYSNLIIRVTLSVQTDNAD